MISTALPDRKFDKSNDLSLEDPTGPHYPRTLAIDTEYHGAHTLTVQVATRLDSGRVAVQIYNSPSIPPMPDTLDIQRFISLAPDRYGRFLQDIVLRPAKQLSSDLSPTRLMADATAQVGVEILPLAAGRQLVQGVRDGKSRQPMGVYFRRGKWYIPDHELTLVGHFLTADLFRVFGRDFWASLQELSRSVEDGIVVQDRRLLHFAKNGSRRTNPILEYFYQDDFFYSTAVQTRDTILPYGRGSLDNHSRTFLGFGKSDVLSVRDKKNMLATFHGKTETAYAYAIIDAINTLLVYEEMQRRDRDIYQQFGITENDCPAMRPTLGGRVNTFLIATTWQSIANDAINLRSDRALTALMEKGGVTLFAMRPGISHYGTQTGRVHGGLLYSRSPLRFWHAAPGMLRDVDMAGCYEKVLSDKSVYWGRPVIFEPGETAMSLRAAVELARRNADDDGWQIRVSGPITAAPNALIPSTDNAITSANYREKLRKGKRQTKQRAFHLEALKDPTSVKGTGGSRLFAAVVESGIVTWATWLIIQALPNDLRKQYENLTADSIIMYPRHFAAANGIEFDALIDRYRNDSLPWSSALDLEGMQIVQTEKLDSDYATLKYPIGDYAKTIGTYRKQAQDLEGKGSGADRAWKMHVNTMYGVLACAYYPTNNFVAANLITAQARAEAFAMSQALNAIQTITDGCTYRADQIPACTFAECVKIKPDYPICRADEGDGIPFHDPVTIPQGDVEFTVWYRQHVKQFFGADSPAFDRLIATHYLEHKKTGKTGSIAFDALAVDGSANYAKCTMGAAGGWQVEDFAARSYGKRSKARLANWMVSTYSTDCLSQLAPVTSEVELLKFNAAGQKARKAIDQGVPEVLFPLGLAHTRVLNYRAIKASGFIFNTPEQRAGIVKQIQKFEEKTGAGLEILCLRRPYRGRRTGSLADLAEAIYTMIRSGRANLAEVLNLNRRSTAIADVSQRRLRNIKRRKRKVEADLIARIDSRNLIPDAMIMALLVRSDDVRLPEATHGLLDG